MVYGDPILHVFFTFPTRGFHKRELSRLAKLSLPSVITRLNTLVEKGLVIRQDAHPYPLYHANHDNPLFKRLKRCFTLNQLEETGLLSYLEETLFPKAIILFGSAARGEDTETSDLDLYVQAEAVSLTLTPYESALNRKISILFEKDFSLLAPHLRNSILNGILLRGYLMVFDDAIHTARHQHGTKPRKNGTPPRRTHQTSR